MGDIPDDKHLQPKTEGNSLSVGALKTGLQVAAKESLSSDEAVLIRQQRPYLRPLSDETVRLVVKEPPMWEFRLYFQALKDFVANESAQEPAPACPERTMTPLETADWISGKFDEYQRLGDKINKLINTKLQAALGPPGQAGDAAAIISVANQVAQVYRRFLDVRAEALALHVSPEVEDVAREFATICDGSIKEFQTYPAKSLETLMNTLATADEETELVLHFEMTLKADTDGFDVALRRARKRITGR